MIDCPCRDFCRTVDRRLQNVENKHHGMAVPVGWAVSLIPYSLFLIPYTLSRIPYLLSFIRLSRMLILIPYSLFYSLSLFLFLIPYPLSLILIPYSLLLIAYCLLSALIAARSRSRSHFGSSGAREPLSIAADKVAFACASSPSVPTWTPIDSLPEGEGA